MLPKQNFKIFQCLYSSKHTHFSHQLTLQLVKLKVYAGWIVRLVNWACQLGIFWLQVKDYPTQTFQQEGNSLAHQTEKVRGRSGFRRCLIRGSHCAIGTQSLSLFPWVLWWLQPQSSFLPVRARWLHCPSLPAHFECREEEQKSLSEKPQQVHCVGSHVVTCTSLNQSY